MNSTWTYRYMKNAPIGVNFCDCQGADDNPDKGTMSICMTFVNDDHSWGVQYLQCHIRMFPHVVHVMHGRCRCVFVMFSASLTLTVIHLQYLLPDLFPSCPRVESMYVVLHAPARKFFFLFCHSSSTAKSTRIIPSALRSFCL